MGVRLLLVVLILSIWAACGCPVEAATVSWTSLYDGGWQNSSMWSSYPYLPGADDNVIISAPTQVRVTHGYGDDQINSLTCSNTLFLAGGLLRLKALSLVSGSLSISGGTLVPSVLTLSGYTDWSVGEINGGGTVNNTGTLIILDGGAKALDCTLNNTGKITQKATDNFNMGLAGVINNEPGALYDVRDNCPIGGGVSSAFNNKGTFRKSAGTAKCGITSLFNNDGLAEVLSGYLSVTNGGGDGTFSVANGAALNFDLFNGPYSGGFTCTGAGAVNLTQGKLQTTGKVTLDMTGGGFNWLGGILAGTGSFYNTGLFTTTQGTRTIDGATLDNAGSMVLTQIPLYLDQSAVLNNLASGTIEMRDNINIEARYGQGAFNNYGTLRATGMQGNFSINAPFTNSGYVDIQSGNMSIMSGASYGGLFDIAYGALLDLSNYNSFPGSYTCTGAGGVTLKNGTLLSDYGGVCFDVTGSTAPCTPTGGLQWSGGTLTGPGGFRNTGACTVTGGGQRVLAATSFSNYGMMTLADGTIQFFNGSTLTNQKNAYLDIQGAADFSAQAPDSGFINNLGTMRKYAVSGSNAGTTTIPVPFNNSGVMELQAGYLTLHQGGRSTNGIFQTSYQTTLKLTDHQTDVYSGSFSCSGAGAVNQLTGTLLSDSSGITFDMSGGYMTTFNWSGGIMKGPGGFRNNGSFMMNGGIKYLDGTTFNNSGKITHSSGPLEFDHYCEFNNMPDGSYDLKTDNAFILGSNSSAVFNNSGTFTKQYSTSLCTLPFPFNNTGGTVEVLSGDLAFGMGGNATGGTLNAAKGAILNLVDQNNTYSGTFTCSGSGVVEQHDNSILRADAGGITFNMLGGSYNWYGGTLRGSGGFNNQGSFNITPGSQKIIDGTVFNNSGSITHTNDVITLANSAILNNLAGGVYDINSSQPFITDKSSAVINNSGLFRKNSLGICGMPVTFNNKSGGLVQVMSGSLELQFGGTGSGGVFDVSQGSTLKLATYDNTTYSGTFSCIGAGTLSHARGVIRADAGGVKLGMIGCGFTWDGGTLSGTGGFTNTGKLNFSGASDFMRLSGARIDNTGIISHTNGAVMLENHAQINNLSGGIYDITGGGFGSIQIGGTFNNSGLFRMYGDAFKLYVPIVFNNDGGTVEVMTGDMMLEAGGKSTGGTFDIANDASLLLTTPNTTYSGSFTCTGTGSVYHGDGIIRADSGKVTFDMTNAFLWYSGTLTGQGGFINKGLMIIDQDVTRNLDRTILENSGTIWQSSGKLQLNNSSTLSNLEDGVYELQYNSIEGDPQTCKFNNAGTLKAIGDTSVSTSMNNTGEIVVEDGLLDLKGPVKQISNGALNGGKWTLISSGYVTTALSILNSGCITVNNADVSLIGPTDFSAINSLQLNTGRLHMENNRFMVGEQFTNSGTVELSDTWFYTGSFINTGTITGNAEIGGNFTNNGVIDPGGLIRTIKVNGDFTQSASGTLNVELAGPCADSHDRIFAVGNAVIDGVLNVTLGRGYNPVLGNYFRVIESYTGVSGRFSKVNYPELPQGLHWEISYNKYDVTLRVEGSIPPVNLPKLGDARSQNDGAWVTANGIVTAAFDGEFYIEDIDRTSGIRVVTADIPPIMGNQVSVTGKIDAMQPNLTIVNAMWTPTGAPDLALTPLFIPLRAIGGGNCGLQKGITSATGLNNIGLLVKTTGKVTYSGAGLLYIDDGSGFNDGNTLGADNTTIPGVLVLLPYDMLVLLPDGDYFVSVTGISTAIMNTSGDPICRALRVRTQADVQVIK